MAPSRMAILVFFESTNRNLSLSEVPDAPLGIRGAGSGGVHRIWQ